MTVTDTGCPAPWLLLVFSMPAKRASQRVAIWRKLQRYGTLPLGSSGYVLPSSAMNQERMEWLATTIRASRGHASVIQANGFDDLPAERLQQRFQEARARDYQKLMQETRKLLAMSSSRRPAGRLNRLRRRLHEIQEIDFFGSPFPKRIEDLLAKADESDGGRPGRKSKISEFHKRMWMTRPRPGIDRVSSAWLIRRSIDAEAHFIFASDPAANPEAIPLDMFCDRGFGHRGEDCTFETLCKQFGVRERRMKRVAEIIHDADLGDEKFGRVEGQGLDKVLIGWAKQGLPDEELLQRGMDLIDGLYESLA